MVTTSQIIVCVDKLLCSFFSFFFLTRNLSFYLDKQFKTTHFVTDTPQKITYLPTRRFKISLVNNTYQSYNL